MELAEAKQLVADTGRELLAKGLVARTWGNISVRVDDTHFAISPSGLGYERMQKEDVPILNREDGTWEGNRKPSSEYKVHAAAFACFDDVNFVIHTHQDYATIVGLVGVDALEMTQEEQALLGKVCVAEYGLPGTDKLKENVADAYKKGSKVVLMLHHGAVILGADKEDAMHKAEVLEAVCKRTIEKKCTADMNRALLEVAEQKNFRPQLDDIAQMVGCVIRVVEDDEAKIAKALSKADAVIVKGRGVVTGDVDPDDREALIMLLGKSAVAKLYTQACGEKASLSLLDCTLMRLVYVHKYSKKKEG